MKKKPVQVTIHELEDILEKYLDGGPGLNYAIKILGHPGVGKSAIVKEVSHRRNYHFIDTRLAFKENIDLGGYPVPDHEARRMVYYRPHFIPPETVPDQSEGILWFLDESNRAHPTVIQTLFQIITEGTCGEHRLPENTSIVLAGNLGEEDSTTITEFDDAALDGRLAIFHLKPSADDWLRWADAAKIHPAIIRYITLYPEKLWSEEHVNPNPRGWHQVSEAVKSSFHLEEEESLKNHLIENRGAALEKMILSLAGNIAGHDFIMQVTAPREITTEDILKGSTSGLNAMEKGSIPAEDLLWSMYGAVHYLKNERQLGGETPGEKELEQLGHLLHFIALSRRDMRIAFFHHLVKECGVLTSIPKAIQRKEDEKLSGFLKSVFDELVLD